MQSGSPCIVFRVDGGEHLGMGHLFKTTILAAEIKKKDASAKIFFFIRKDAAGYKWLKRQGAKITRIPGGVALTAEPDWILKRTAPYLKRGQQVLFVTDILDLPKNYAKRINELGVKHLTFENRASKYIADVTINAIVDGLRNRVSRRNSRAVFSGPCWRVFNQDYQAIHRKPKRNQILVSFGGGDDNQFSLELANALSKLVPKKAIKVIIGPAQKLPATPCGNHIHIKKGLPSIAMELNRSELLVCAGGGTLYEAALLGVPAIALAKVKHQIRNIRMFQNAGSAVCAGKLKLSNTAKTAKLAAQLLSNRKKLLRMSTAGPKIVDGKGTLRVLEIIQNLIKRENL